MNTETIENDFRSPYSPTESSPKSEGKLTKTIENQTAKAPSMTWLGLAVGSMAISAGFQLFSEKKELGVFVCQWAPCFLLIGIYNKLVKVEGNDRESKDYTLQ